MKNFLMVSIGENTYFADIGFISQACILAVGGAEKRLLPDDNNNLGLEFICPFQIFVYIISYNHSLTVFIDNILSI